MIRHGLFWLTALAALPPDGETWHALDTPSFAVVGNAEPEQLALVARNLEALKAVLARTGQEAGSSGARPIPVVVFRSTSSFEPYRRGFGRGAKNVAGYFTQSMGVEFIALNVAAGSSPYPTVYHEYLHSVVRAKFGQVPLWFNEGIAGVYETFTCDGKDAIVGRASRERLVYMTDHRWLPLAELLTVGENVHLHENDDDQTAAFYAHSWLLTHDLLFGHPERRKQLAVYLEAHRRGVDRVTAFEQSFAGGIQGVDKELREYVRGRLPFVTLTFEQLQMPEPGAARAVARADVLVTLGRLLLTSDAGATAVAAEHFRGALALRPDDPAARAGLALAAYREDRKDEAAKLLDPILDSGYDDQAALRAGASLAFDADAKAGVLRARDLVARALLQAPEDVELLSLFGATFVGEAGDTASGIAALERADGLEPGGAAVLGNLASLYSQKRDRAKVEAIARRVEGKRDPALQATVGQALANLDIAESNDAIRARDLPTAIAKLRSAREKTQTDAAKTLIDARIQELEAAAAAAAAKKKSAPKR